MIVEHFPIVVVFRFVILASKRNLMSNLVNKQLMPMRLLRLPGSMLLCFYSVYFAKLS